MTLESGRFNFVCATSERMRKVCPFPMHHKCTGIKLEPLTPLIFYFKYGIYLLDNFKRKI